MDLSLIIGAVMALVVVSVLVVWRQPVFVFAQRSVGFLQQVRSEVRKISWPSWDDLRKSTIIITILVIIVGIIIGIMDAVFSKILIDWFGRAIG
jgi:preprotein translocase subunit SecE